MKVHQHILKTKSILDSSYLKCEICNLAFEWDILKQRYIQIKIPERRNNKMSYKVINEKAGSSSKRIVGTYKTLTKARKVRNQYKMIGNVKNIKIKKVR